MAEARACLVKAKTLLGESRNLKADIKSGVTQAIERLYEIVKEVGKTKDKTARSQDLERKEEELVNIDIGRTDQTGLMKELIQNLKQHKDTLIECKQYTTDLSAKLMQIPKSPEGKQGLSYAEVTKLTKTIDDLKNDLKSYAKPQAVYADVVQHTGQANNKIVMTTESVHSMIVSSVDSSDTSENVIAKIRSAVNAKVSGLRVDRLRKAREGKVVLGCETKDELAKVAEKLKSEQPALLIEEKLNKDPLIIIKNVLSVNTDEDIQGALRNQNASVLAGIPEAEYRAVVKYRRRARNPHECHVVLQVSPSVWKCLTSAGRIHIDLQRVQVCDQSPLIQCSKCLAYGHGRKSCSEAADLCSHCTGQHLRKDCPHWRAGDEPTCRNCTLAKMEKVGHNSFDSECQIRKKWDRLARSRVSYC